MEITKNISKELLPLDEMLENIKRVFARKGMDGIRSFLMTGMFGKAPVKLAWNGRANTENKK